MLSGDETVGEKMTGWFIRAAIKQTVFSPQTYLRVRAVVRASEYYAYELYISHRLRRILAPYCDRLIVAPHRTVMIRNGRLQLSVTSLQQHCSVNAVASPIG